MSTKPGSVLSPTVNRAFEKWINCETWHTGHPNDEERFYRFVWTVSKNSRRPPTENHIQSLIINKWSSKLENSYLNTQAMHYSSLYATLLEFSKVRNKSEYFLLSQFENG